MAAASRSTSRPHAALAALAAILLALVLPGLHGFDLAAINHAHDHLAQASEPCHHHHDDCVDHQQGHHHDCEAGDNAPDSSPSHDHRDCEVCKLIELLPSRAVIHIDPPGIVHIEAPLGLVRQSPPLLWGFTMERWTPARGPPVG